MKKKREYASACMSEVQSCPLEEFDEKVVGVCSFSGIFYGF